MTLPITTILPRLFDRDDLTPGVSVVTTSGVEYYGPALETERGIHVVTNERPIAWTDEEAGPDGGPPTWRVARFIPWAQIAEVAMAEAEPEPASAARTRRRSPPTPP